MFTANVALVVLLFLFSTCQSVINYPRLSVEVKNAGFHRELHYSIKLPKEIDCDMLLVQTLHQGLYISNDQLNDLKRMKMINSYVPSYINVELPMEKSQPFTIYLFEKARSNVQIKLPIHLRYQSPAKTNFKGIPLYDPNLYFSCSSEFYERKSNNETFKLPCPSSSNIANIQDLPNADSCDWYDVDHITDFQGPRSISIPVGNSSLAIPVFILTLLVAWAAAVYLIFAVFKKKQQINKKVS